MSQAPTVVVFLRVSPELRDRLAAAAKAQHRPVAHVAIEAIKLGLPTVGKNPAQLDAFDGLPTPMRTTAAMRAPVSRATVELASKTAAKVSGPRKAKPTAKRPSKKGGR